MIDKKQEKPFFCKHLPIEITMLLMLCFFLPAFLLGTELGDTLFIICRYGLKAYSGGLRVESWSRGILNTGEELRWHIDLARAIFGYILVVVFMVVGIWLCDLWFSRYQRKKRQ